MARNKPKGWVKEPVRHGLAAKGIKTVLRKGQPKLGGVIYVQGTYPEVKRYIERTYDIKEKDFDMVGTGFTNEWKITIKSSSKYARYGAIFGGRATPGEAKKIVRQWLAENNIDFTKLTAKSIGFADLARDNMVFVHVHGWSGGPEIEELEEIVREFGFRVEVDSMFS